MPVKVHDDAAVMERTARRSFRGQLIGPDNINIMVKGYLFQVAADLGQFGHLDSDEKW